MAAGLWWEKSEGRWRKRRGECVLKAGPGRGRMRRTPRGKQSGLRPRDAGAHLAVQRRKICVLPSRVCHGLTSVAAPHLPSRRCSLQTATVAGASKISRRGQPNATAPCWDTPCPGWNDQNFGSQPPSPAVWQSVRNISLFNATPSSMRTQYPSYIYMFFCFVSPARPGNSQRRLSGVRQDRASASAGGGLWHRRSKLPCPCSASRRSRRRRRAASARAGRPQSASGGCSGTPCPG